MLFTSENWHINLIGSIRKEISMNTKLWIRSQVCPSNLGNVNEYRNDRLLASALASFVFFYKWGTQQSKDTKSLFVFQVWQQFVREIDLCWVNRDPESLCLCLRVVLVISRFIVGWQNFKETKQTPGEDRISFLSSIKGGLWSRMLLQMLLPHKSSINLIIEPWKKMQALVNLS